MSLQPATKQKKIEFAAQLLRSSRHAVVLTGAGISTPSGIPDFRSRETGLWSKDDPMEIASLTSFLHRPERFYNWLRPLLLQTWHAQPNAAHLALARMEAQGIVKAIITQNIDGLHRAAGSQNVIEVHGSLDEMECPTCLTHFPSKNFREIILKEEAGPPSCPACNHIVKPAITLFEEFLPPQAWSTAEEHCGKADLIFVIGSSLVVMPAASLPYDALEHGARLIINTFSSTPLDRHAALLLPYEIVEILPAIMQAL
ncbi:MAG: NAD-dependent deacylase [Anaerolineaceae bacterium]|nr:NAD-dependent deacylase [Anaerolineaceae bacterium]